MSAWLDQYAPALIGWTFVGFLTLGLLGAVVGGIKAGVKGDKPR